MNIKLVIEQDEDWEPKFINFTLVGTYRELTKVFDKAVRVLVTEIYSVYDIPLYGWKDIDCTKRIWIDHWIPKDRKFGYYGELKPLNKALYLHQKPDFKQELDLSWRDTSQIFPEDMMEMM